MGAAFSTERGIPNGMPKEANEFLRKAKELRNCTISDETNTIELPRIVGTNCRGGDGAGSDGRGDDSGDNRRGDDSGGFETRPYGAVRYRNNIMKRD